MFCPNCGSQNAEGTKFCRTCGANLSLVPQALTGELSNDRSSRRRRRREQEGPPNIGHGITKLFMGIGFIFVALGAWRFAPAGRLWWFWMLIPAFTMLGKGISEIITASITLKQMHGIQPTTAAMPPRRVTGELPPEPPAFQLPPPSVTEDTTRHLDPDKDRYPHRP